MGTKFNEGFVLGQIAKEKIPIPFFGEELLEAYSLRFHQVPEKEFVIYRFKVNPKHDPITNILTEKMFLWQIMDAVHGIPLLIPSLIGQVPYQRLLTKEAAVTTAAKMLKEFEVATSDNLEAIFRAFFIIRGNYEHYLKKTARKFEASA